MSVVVRNIAEKIAQHVLHRLKSNLHRGGFAEGEFVNTTLWLSDTLEEYRDQTGEPGLLADHVADQLLKRTLSNTEVVDRRLLMTDIYWALLMTRMIAEGSELHIGSHQTLEAGLMATSERAMRV